MSATATNAPEGRPDLRRAGLIGARPTALAYEDARKYLDFASRHAPARSRLGLALRRTVAEYGRASGAARAEGVRIGVHLFAGRAAAACVAAHLRTTAPDDGELHRHVDAVAAALWPDALPSIPTLASMRAGTALRRYARTASYDASAHPALEHLATAAMSTELPLANRYTAALHRLTATTHRFHSEGPQRHDTAARALAALLAVGPVGGRAAGPPGPPGLARDHGHVHGRRTRDLGGACQGARTTATA